MLAVINYVAGNHGCSGATIARVVFKGDRAKAYKVIARCILAGKLANMNQTKGKEMFLVPPEIAKEIAK